jgi:hypothetical protein
MTWYAVSAVLLFRFKEGSQDVWPIWENVYLVSADSPEEAESKGAALAKEAAGNDDGSLTCNRRPARLEFRGIRKVLTIQNVHAAGDDPVDGAEITFSEMELRSEGDLQALVEGKPVPITYVE